MQYRQATIDDIPALVECSKWGLPVYRKYGFTENETILTIEVPEGKE